MTPRPSSRRAMLHVARRGAGVAGFAFLALVAAAPGHPASAEATLAIRWRNQWVTWWREGSAPTHWTAPHPLVARSVAWQEASPGVQWATVRLAGTGEATRLGVVLLRLDPARVRFELRGSRADALQWRPWSIADADTGALAAFNAGQFTIAGPWGWLVSQGSELQAPGVGPLSGAFVVDSAGKVDIIGVADIENRRGRGIANGFQSYPMILEPGGKIPLAVREPGRGTSFVHRDARLALALLRDGHVLLALTRFDALGGLLGELPFGPTTREMAAIVGALGADRAVLLDGGISGQLMIRDGDRVREWRGLRKVPLAMVVLPRTRE